VFHQTRIAFVASCILSSLNYGVKIPTWFHPVTKDSEPQWFQTECWKAARELSLRQEGPLNQLPS